MLCFYRFFCLYLAQNFLIMDNYLSEPVYISSAATNIERLNRINQIILALETAMLGAVGNEPISEYQLDDGQTKIRTVYRSLKSMSDALDMLNKQKQRLLNDLNGRNIALRSWQGLRQ